MKTKENAFAGFPAGKTHLTPVPAHFFTELLPQIDDLGELKICLYAIWRLDQQEGNLRFLRRSDIAADKRFVDGLSPDAGQAETCLDDALARAVARKVLLAAKAEGQAGSEMIYFLNSARGRASIQALQNGDWDPANAAQAPISLEVETPNIFRLYEENIGPLSPMIADALRDAEQEYPADWIDEAVRIAALNNVRRWRYVEAILRSWKEEGKHDSHRGDASQDRRKYSEGKFARFFEH
jgi:DNA replication protein